MSETKIVSGITVERIGNAILILGDAQVVFTQEFRTAVGIPRADVVASDPPYLLTTGGPNNPQMGGAFANGDYRNDGHFVECNLDWHDVMRVFMAASRETADIYSMCDDKNVRACLNAAFDAGFDFHRLCIWRKDTATPNRWYMKDSEFAAYLFRGNARRLNDCGSKQSRDYPRPSPGTGHPTEKPVALMAEYICNSSNPGDVVCDPFMGSGTTGVAAIRSGRKFVGCEVDPKWFAIARDRIAATTANPNLFGYDVPNARKAAPKNVSMFDGAAQ